MANGCTGTPGDGQEKMQFFWWMSSHIGACRPTVQLEHLVSVHEDSLTALERNRH
jgi:hypothetical protein